MEQISMFEFIEDEYTRLVKEELENTIEIAYWLNSFDEPDDYYMNCLVHLVHYSGLSNWAFNNRYMSIKDYKKLVIKIAQTHTFHFANMDKDIYISSFKINEFYYRIFHIKDMILVSDIHLNKFSDEIIFPAMTIHMFNSKGYPISFENREKFIMDYMGFKEIGVIRDKIFKNMRDFTTIKATWKELLVYFS